MREGSNCQAEKAFPPTQLQEIGIATLSDLPAVTMRPTHELHFGP